MDLMELTVQETGSGLAEAGGVGRRKSTSGRRGGRRVSKRLTQHDLEAIENEEEEEEERKIMGNSVPADLASRVEEIITHGKGKYDQGRDTKVMVLRGPYRPVQGNRVKKISSAPGYKLHFDFKLDGVPEQTANILHLQVRGLKDTAMPSVSVLGGTRRLALNMQLGAAHATLVDKEDCELHKVYKVYMEYRHETLSFKVGPHEMQLERELPLKVPVPSMFEVYVCSPNMEAAKGTITAMVFEPHFEDEMMIAAHKPVKDLELPPEERALLDAAKVTIEKNRQWARFDAFFGIFVCANSLLVGLEIEYNKNNLMIFTVLDNMFIIVFGIELILRVKLSQLYTITKFIQDPWLIFDAAVLLQSMAETWILPELPGYLGILRMVRALKLAKMVRLVRAFRELGMLVEGMLNSFHTLMWTLLLLFLVTYIGALILVRTAKLNLEAVTPKEQETLAELMSVLPAMARLVSMATFDQWASYIRDVAWGVGGVKGVFLSLELILFLGFVGIGILNMVAGILCHTAFILNQKYKHMKAVELLLFQQKAMRSLRKTLCTWGERPLFQSDRFIGMDEFFEALTSTQQMEAFTDEEQQETSGNVDGNEDTKFSPHEAAKVLKLTGEELLSLCDTFAEDGQIEIDGLMEAIQTKELQAYYGFKSADWIGSKKKSTLRPVDMVSFTYSVRLAEKYLSSIERNLTGTCSMAYDSLQFLHEQAKKADTLLRMDRPDWSPPMNQPAIQPVLVDVKDLESCVNLTQYSGEESRMFMPIDTLFGLLNVTNAIFIGVQMSGTSSKEQELAYYFVDCFFTLAFTLEFFIRTVLYAHLQEMQEDEEGTLIFGNMIELSRKRLEKVSRLRSRMRLYIFPPCPPGSCCTVCWYFPGFLSEAANLGDFIIVSVSLCDSLLIANLRRLGLTSADPSVLSLLRVFRVFRLARAFRVFRMFPMLQLFIFALYRVWKTVAWTFALMILFIYMYSLYAHVVLEPIESLKPFFGKLGDSILTGWRLTTFDNWSEIILATANASPINVCTLYLLVVFIGLGLMKMLIGVMSESAISLMQSREADRAKEEMNIYLLEMTNLRVLFQEQFSTDLMPQEFVEKALGICIRPKRSGPLNPADGVTPMPEAKKKEGLNADFSSKLLRIFSRAKMSPDLVKQVFERVDHTRSGYVNINSFALCGMAVKEDASHTNVFAAITAIRQVRSLVTELSVRLRAIHSKMETLLEDVSTLVTRTRYTPRSKADRKTKQSLGKFGANANLAVEELASFSGTVPALKSLGKLKVVNGRGKLSFFHDEAEGTGTYLRGEVKPGDMLLVGIPMGPEDEAQAPEEKMTALTVHSIIGHERIKLMQKFPSAHSKKPFPFLIVKSQATAEGRGGAGNGDVPTVKEVDYTHNLHMHSQLSPRSAQLFIDWELGTKRRHDVKFHKLAKEKTDLTLQMVDLMRDLDAIANLELVHEVFKLWQGINKSPRDKELSAP